MIVRRNFFRGGVEILLILLRLLTMQSKRTFTKRFTLSAPKEIAPFYGNSYKKCTSLAAIVRYIAISYKIGYLQIFETGYFFAKKQIAMVFNKTTIMSFFTQYDLPPSLGNKSCKRLRSCPKQSNTISIKPCLSLLNFSRWTWKAFSLTRTRDFSNLSCFFWHSRL